MRKGITEGRVDATALTLDVLKTLENKGYNFVQVKGLTIDKHFDYMEPQFLLLVPFIELPTDPEKKDIYEPIKSELLKKWASDINEYPEILVSSEYL